MRLTSSVRAFASTIVVVLAGGGSASDEVEKTTTPDENIDNERDR